MVASEHVWDDLVVGICPVILEKPILVSVGTWLLLGGDCELTGSVLYFLDGDLIV